MQVKVTAEDIKMGDPCEPNACPITLSIRRQVKTHDITTCYGFVEIGKHIYVPVERKRFDRFIWDFDQSEHYPDSIPAPTTFELRKLDLSQELTE